MAISDNSGQGNSRPKQARQFQAVPGKAITNMTIPVDLRQGNYWNDNSRKLQAMQFKSRHFQAIPEKAIPGKAIQAISGK